MREFVTFKWIAVAYDLLLKERGYSDGTVREIVSRHIYG